MKSKKEIIQEYLALDGLSEKLYTSERTVQTFKELVFPVSLKDDEADYQRSDAEGILTRLRDYQQWVFSRLESHPLTEALKTIQAAQAATENHAAAVNRKKTKAR